MPSRVSSQEARTALDWDVVNWSRALGLWKTNLPQGPLRVLTVGDRNGGLAWWFAQQGYEVVCTDVELQHEVIASKLGDDSRVRSETADLLNLSYRDSEFDVVAFKSVLGAMRTEENQGKAMSEVSRVLKPGGLLLFAENTEASPLHRFFRKKFVSWGNSWKYLDPKEDAHLFDDFEEVAVSSHGFFGAFGRSETQRRMGGALDKVFGPITPRGWKYIYFGVLRKN